MSAPPPESGDDLEEVSADFFGGAVDAGDGEAGNGGRFLGDEDVLNFLRGLDLKLHPRLALAVEELLAGDGEDESEEKQRVEDESNAEEVRSPAWNPMSLEGGQARSSA